MSKRDIQEEHMLNRSVNFRQILTAFKRILRL
jgi:hypothetical protein